MEELVAFHLAGALLALVQLFRTRDRRLLPVALSLAFGALGHYLGEWHRIGRLCLYASAASTLWLLFLLVPRPRASA